MNINDLLLKDSEQKIIKIQPCKGNCGRLVMMPRVEFNKKIKKVELYEKEGI